MENYSVEVTDISKRYPLVTNAPRHNTFVGNFLSLLYSPIKNLTELRKLSKAQDSSQTIDGFLLGSSIPIDFVPGIGAITLIL